MKDYHLIASLHDKLIHQGKVRDTYVYPEDTNVLISLASDRISIFDFVLPVLVPRKGEVLTALTHFWLTDVLKGLPNHLNQVFDASDPTNVIFDIQRDIIDIPLIRTLAIDKLEIIPFELIFRGHLGGSVWKSYEKTGIVAGLELPVGLTKWQKLDTPLFTPSTKSDTGHDVNIKQRDFYLEGGSLKLKAVALAHEAYTKAYEYALKRGIVILDTKFEVGVKDGECFLADEVLTPDSSRFTTIQELNTALQEKKDPPFHDKEPVRAWGRTIDTPFLDDSNREIVGINGLDPENPQHVDFVHGLTVPQQVVKLCTDRYLDIFQKLTNIDLGTYQLKYLL